MPAHADRMLRWVVVTSDMHRIHHSVIPQECHRNYGFNLPWRDRMLGTYLYEPILGHEHMTLGLEQCQDPIQLTWLNLLALPFVGEGGDYATWNAEQREVVVGNMK